MIKKETELKLKALLIAMAVRNEMDDFRAEHLTDAQMAILNPLIRNAIYGMLHLFEGMSHDRRAILMLAEVNASIPEYSEMPTIPESLDPKSLGPKNIPGST
jgi:hypothetical protein